MVITFTYMYIVIFLLGKLASKQTSPMDPTSIWDKPCTPNNHLLMNGNMVKHLFFYWCQSNQVTSAVSHPFQTLPATEAIFPDRRFGLSSQLKGSLGIRGPLRKLRLLSKRPEDFMGRPSTHGSHDDLGYVVFSGHPWLTAYDKSCWFMAI